MPPVKIIDREIFDRRFAFFLADSHGTRIHQILKPPATTDARMHRHQGCTSRSLKSRGWWRFRTFFCLYVSPGEYCSATEMVLCGFYFLMGSAEVLSLMQCHSELLSSVIQLCLIIWTLVRTNWSKFIMLFSHKCIALKSVDVAVHVFLSF